MMNTNTMKHILHDKLIDENCNFKLSDISIKKNGEITKIVIRDYEHIVFTLKIEHDDYFGYIITIKNNFDNDCIWRDTPREYEIDKMIESALLGLGYKIGNEF